MRSHRSSAAFEKWMRAATRSLPASVEDRLQSEIADHYLAQVDDRIAAGQPQAEAEAQAVRQLGVPEDVRAHYRDSYFSRQHYRRGMWALLVGLCALVAEYLIQKFYLVEWPSSLLWDICFSLLWGFTVLTTAQAITTFCWERYHVRVSARWQRLFRICVGLLVFGNTLYLFYLLPIYDMSFAGQALLGIKTSLLQVVFVASKPFSQVGATFTVLLILLYSMQVWKSTRTRKNVLFQASLWLITLAVLITCGHVAATMNMLPMGAYHKARYYWLFATPVMLSIIFPAFTLFFLMLRNRLRAGIRPNNSIIASSGEIS